MYSNELREVIIPHSTFLLIEKEVLPFQGAMTSPKYSFLIKCLSGNLWIKQ